MIDSARTPAYLAAHRLPRLARLPRLPRLPRLAQAAATVAVAAALLTACGGGGSGDASGAADVPTSDAPSSVTADATAPTSTELCSRITAAQVSEALGATATTEVGPIGECRFDQEDLHEISGMVSITPIVDGAGGYEGYRSGTTAAMEGAVTQDLDGIGEAAFVTLGRNPGGENLQAASGAMVGDVIVTLNLSQGTGHTAEEMTEVSRRLLALAVDAL